MTLNVALLGAGRIGKVHARAVNAVAGARLLAVADPLGEAATALASAYGAEVRDVAAIEVATDIDAVIVCTPTDTHADLIERFARAGKAIFCEKPVDLSVERVRACLKVVEGEGATLMLGFQRRFDAQFRAARDAIAAGTIGTVEMVQIVSRDPGPPPPAYIASSGGIFRDMTIHDFDMARFLLGEEIEAVQASASVLTDPEIGRLGDYDSASIILTTASGRHCSISNSRRATYGYDQRAEVLGSKGMVAVANERPVSVVTATGDGFCAPPLHDFFMTRYEKAYAAEIEAFVGFVQSGRAPSPGGDDGLRALVIAEAAARSITEGRTVRTNEI
ncbi:myo-inositol 2-dehydrogenase [Breoghania corrubedonensis]|uniref:Myo-inositol 2-dehydrogenase n=1 Tax=Breoghania corrubedonensis TaxID=665038 RepID=A0A2T5UYK8_9HYPH|nr:inositol 2-dehydrogenase [Breoghania corrubedonensis]PTW56585.1 myo-inositol 2-dehydrogenase [Breoghania corrubedonensis]